jgi:succinyl-CoA synthetase beta subunit
MRLLEDVAKQTLADSGLPVPPGRAASSAADASAAALEVAGPGARVAVKALVAAGRRGKAGAVSVCAAGDAGAAAARMIGLTVGGQPVERVYVEQAVAIETELYLSFAFGPLAAQMVASRHGGVDIERTAHDEPGSIVRREIDPVEGLRLWQAAALWDDAGVPSALVPKLAAITLQLHEAFVRADALMLEVNPLVVTGDGALSVVGTMMEIDDNALWRHPHWQALADETAGPGGRALTAGERAVGEANREFPGGATRYTELDGDIGLLVSGGGASLYQHDLILHYGGRPANHTDFSPTPTPDKQVAVLDAIFARPGIKGLLIGCNYLQLARCDLMVEALAISLQKNGIDTRRFPVVIRLFGPREQEARAIAGRFPGVRYLPRGTSLAEACRTIVEAVREVPPEETAR